MPGVRRTIMKVKVPKLSVSEQELIDKVMRKDKGKAVDAIQAVQNREF